MANNNVQVGSMKKGLIHFGMAAVLSCLLIVSPADANSDKVRLKTAVVETMLVPESGEALSWERSFPETMFMPRDIERAGVRGCGIFSFNIGKDGKAKDIETEAAVPRFGLSRLARDYIKLGDGRRNLQVVSKNKYCCV